MKIHALSLVVSSIIFLSTSAAGLEIGSNINIAGLGSKDCQKLYIARDYEKLVPTSEKGIDGANYVTLFRYWSSGYLSSKLQAANMGFENSEELINIQDAIIEVCRKSPSKLIGTATAELIDALIEITREKAAGN
jgi:hypothetical protein